MNDTLAAVFDADAVRSLTGDPGDLHFAIVFVTRYRALLPERVRRIEVALAAEDHDDAMDDAMDAVLSLKVASITAGARELAGLVTQIEGLVRGGDLAKAAEVDLRAPAARADRALREFLGG